MTDTPIVQNENPDAYAKKLELAEALAGLNVKEKAITSSKGYGKAYFWSFVLPPMGLYYFFKFLFFSGGESDDIKAGVISLFLTVASLVISIWSLSLLFNQSSSLLPMKDIQGLKDIASPENQKQILELYK